MDRVTFSVSCTDPFVAIAYRSAFISLLSWGSLPHSSRRYRVTSFSTCFPAPLDTSHTRGLPTVLPPRYPILLVVVWKIAMEIIRVDAICTPSDDSALQELRTQYFPRQSCVGQLAPRVDRRWQEGIDLASKSGLARCQRHLGDRTHCISAAASSGDV